MPEDKTANRNGRGTGRDGGRRAVAITLVLSGVLVVLIALGALLLSPEDDSSHQVRLPERVLDYPLTGRVGGPRALDEIASLHRGEFELTSGLIGFYGLGDEVILWVAETSSERGAEQMLTDMAARIAEGNSPFRPAGELQFGARRVYQAEGLGQTHFYFLSGAQVIWTACDEPLGERALSEVLAFYP